MKALFILISLVWIASEIILKRLLRADRRGASELDKNSLRWLWITIGIAVTCGVYTASLGIGSIHYYYRPLQIIGTILIIAGLALRWTAILTLRKFFTVNVAVFDDHQLVTEGVYKYIRHPAYSGSLLSFLGLGLALTNWISIIVIAVPITMAFIYRIKIEENVLRSIPGLRYEAYSEITYRLFPGIY